MSEKRELRESWWPTVNAHIEQLPGMRTLPMSIECNDASLYEKSEHRLHIDNFVFKLSEHGVRRLGRAVEAYLSALETMRVPGW